MVDFIVNWTNFIHFSMELQTPKYNKINNEEADINLCLGLGTDT
jgi:hypothetical protein